MEDMEDEVTPSALSSSLSQSHKRMDTGMVSLAESADGGHSSMGSIGPPLLPGDIGFQHQLVQLKQQQEIQQRLLLQQFQEQQQRLAQQHEKQLHERIREYMDTQRQLEEEQKVQEKMLLDRRLKEEEKLLALKRKEKHEQSAVASSEVKKKLQEFVLLKKQREAQAANGSSSPPIPFSSGSTSHLHHGQGHHPGHTHHPHPHTSSVSGSQSALQHSLTSSPTTTSTSQPVTPPTMHTPPSLMHPMVSRTIHGPLKRTHSAPLPLSHPLIASCQAGPLVDPQQHQRNLVKQHIRQTVLTRASSKQQLHKDSFEEETEAAVAQEMKDETGIGSSSMDQSSGPTATTTAIPARIPLPLTHVPPSPQHHQWTKRQFSQETMSPGDNNVVDLTKGSSRESTPDSGIRSFEHRDSSSSFHSGSGATCSTTSSSFHHPDLMLDQALFQQLLLHQQQQQQQLLVLQQHQALMNPSSTSSSTSTMIVPSSSGSACSSHIPVPMSLNLQVDAPEGMAVGFPSPLSGQPISLIPDVNQLPQVIPHSRLPLGHLTRPLSRALSSPMVSIGTDASAIQGPHSPPVSSGPRLRFTTALVYDNLMLKHQCNCGNNNNHPEHGGRLQSIWARLQETGLAHRCERIRSRKASLEEIRSCHSEAYTLLFGTSPLNRQKLDPNKLVDLPIKSFVMLPCGGIGVDSDTTWNELHTASASRTAAGCVTELALKIAASEIRNGFAVVRPPGHHAEHQQAMGFCFFNSIAIAAKQVIARLGLERVLILDWDVHHGNGIQQIFFQDPRVLYVSIHRHDDGNFFPGTGDLLETGSGPGVGFNVNVPWRTGTGTVQPIPLGDAEYLSAFRSVILPICREFDPELVLVSCGFDAAAGHAAPLGGYKVTPACFGWMTKQVMMLAKGKVLLALEGGYDLASICDASQEVVQSLLEDDHIPPLSEESIKRKPCPSAVDDLRRVISVQVPHWPSLKRFIHLIDCSHSESLLKEREESEAVSAFASLTMQHISSPPPTGCLPVAAALHPMVVNMVSPSESEEPMDQDSDK